MYIYICRRAFTLQSAWARGSSCVARLRSSIPCRPLRKHRLQTGWARYESGPPRSLLPEGKATPGAETENVGLAATGTPKETRARHSSHAEQVGGLLFSSNTAPAGGIESRPTIDAQGSSDRVQRARATPCTADDGFRSYAATSSGLDLMLKQWLAIPTFDSHVSRASCKPTAQPRALRQVSQQKGSELAGRPAARLPARRQPLRTGREGGESSHRRAGVQPMDCTWQLSP